MISKEILADIVQSIIESADEIAGKETRDSQDYGELLGYAESLSIIRDVCDTDLLKDIGLDFDIDKRYLF